MTKTHPNKLRLSFKVQLWPRRKESVHLKKPWWAKSFWSDINQTGEEKSISTLVSHQRWRKQQDCNEQNLLFSLMCFLGGDTPRSERHPETWREHHALLASLPSTSRSHSRKLTGSRRPGRSSEASLLVCLLFARLSPRRQREERLQPPTRCVQLYQ